MKKRILTGLQPSGSITIGNYIGAIKQMEKYQEEYDSFIFVADMHAITVPQDSKKLSQNIRSLVAIYIACGIDPKKNTIFIQSENLYHANTSWVLECLTPYGELGRMTQFKDKVQKHQNFSAGLLTYPVLMASDILLYDVDYVPTGQDQKQHVELARNVASKANNHCGYELFKLPEPLIPEAGAKIMDLVDPSKKMSKSEENVKGVLFLLDDEKSLRKKIMSATTDSDTVVKYDVENKPGISNLITIYTSLTDMSIEEIEQKYKDVNYGTFKKDLADIVVNKLKPIQEKYYELLESEELDKILDKGIRKTNKIAKQKYLELKQAMGLHR
jgi:tryptophanyl-tRNA synthetase